MTDGNARGILAISSSLRGGSRSRRLAREAADALRRMGEPVEFADLRDFALPFAGGAESWASPAARRLSGMIEAAQAILLAMPVYNFGVNAAAKNLIELTGGAWEGKPVGFLLAAGGAASYMAPLGLANSMMLDFRSVIIPRFVYAAADDFDDRGEIPGAIRERVEQLVRTAAAMGRALEAAKRETASVAS